MSENNHTESTDQTGKSELDNKIEHEPPENFNYINISNDIEFKSPENKVEWGYIFQNTYHFKQDIGRVWFFIKNFDCLSLISNDGHYPCVNVKGKETWNVGNIFKGNLHKIYPFIARVEKNMNFPEVKIIKWMFYNIKDNYYFDIKLSLFQVTEDNSTVLLKKIKFEKNEKINYDEIKTAFNSVNLYKYIDGLLDKDPINLLRYESGIINGKMEDIYNVISDTSKITAIAPNNHIMPNFSIKDLKVGEKKEVSLIKNNEILKLYVTLKCKETIPGYNKWVLAMEIEGDENKKIPKHTSLIQLTKINNNECQLIMLTKYHEPINCQEFNNNCNKKKYIIMSIKDYFENFYSPEASN